MKKSKNDSTNEASLQNAFVLVVDDVQAVVEVLREGLSEYGQSVLTALSGEEALEIFKTNPVNLVICDLWLTGISGWNVGKEIMKICQKKKIAKPPFILLTAYDDKSREFTQIDESGVDGVALKPIEMEKLVELIHHVTEKNRGNGLSSWTKPTT